MLSRDFLKYITQTTNVFAYKLNAEYISPNVIFPNASAVTLINCSSTGVSNILKPRIFPNLTTINYLSLHPGDLTIAGRFVNEATKINTVKWVVPNTKHPFYTQLVEANVADIDENLIETFIYNKKNQKNQKNRLIEFNLHVHGYDIIDGGLYRAQFTQFLSMKKNESNLTYVDNLLPTYNPQNNRFRKEMLEMEFFESMHMTF
jgi:hypothetical protein